ncbi:MAG TPA: thiol reductant ABC exporter subunit CydC [Rectinemataceae bacterium]|nr:thiol reductant ABC exporter subunit CydC [Rectinemataceae bacterium]
MKAALRDGRNLLRLAALIRPHWRRAALGVLLALAAALANIGLLALSSWFIASMAIAGALGAVIDYTLPAAGVRALAIVRAAGRYAERLVNHDTTFRVLSSIRLWFFRKIEPLAPARLAEFRSGDLLARIRSDIDTLDDFYVRGLVPALTAVLVCACILPFLAHIDPAIAWIDGAALAAAGLAVPLALGSASAAPGRSSVRDSAELRASIVEEVEGMAELVVLGAAEAHARSTDGSAALLEADRRRLDSLRALGDASIPAMASLAVTLAALVLIPRVASGALPPADLAMLTVFVLASFETVVPLPVAIQKAGEMAQAARRLFEIIDAEPAVASRPLPEAGGSESPRPAASASAAAVPGAAAARTAVGLAIRDLHFRYAPGLPLVFDGFSLEVPPGARIALAGPSGAGKSTLVNLLLRFWDYEGGSIELGGRDIRSFDPDQARAHFSVMPQSPFLYHASIRENLLLAALSEGGKPGPEVEERLREALEAAQLSRFVASLSEGLDTVVGETGRAVSGGEAQRIAAARAFLKDAPIMLLDEPTEGLDDRNADALLAAIAERAAGRTLIIISHRERDLALAERVCRLTLVSK